MVFESFRQSFDELLSRATKPEDRRAVASRMKDTLVQARIGLDDLREGLEKSRQRLAVEEKELETVRRRKTLAEGISDRQTVEIATKYEEMHVQRVDVVRQKVAAQEAELALAEHDVAAMSAELKAVLGGTDPLAAQASPAIDPVTESENQHTALNDELNSLGRARATADRAAAASRRLDELKRKMGK
jgi:hypothetical protein